MLGVLWDSYRVHCPGVNVSCSVHPNETNPEIYANEINSLLIQTFFTCIQKSAFSGWVFVCPPYILKVRDAVLGYGLFFLLFKTYKHNFSKLLLVQIVFGIRISLQYVNTMNLFLPELLWYLKIGPWKHLLPKAQFLNYAYYSN